MNEQKSTSFLRDFLLRRKLNLSDSSWNQFNDRWHDEIYITKQNDIFKRHRKPLIFSSIKEIKIETEENQKDKENQEIGNNDLEIFKNQLNEIQLQLIGLTILNIGLMTYCLFKK